MKRNGRREPHDSSNDPLLAEAEYDDEPYTEDERAAQAGREAFQRGEFSSLEVVWRELVEEDERASS